MKHTPPYGSHGSALVSLMVLLITAATLAGTLTLQHMASRAPAQFEQGRQLALAAEALKGQAFRQRCVDRTLPLDQLLPCPDASGNEGIAGSSCPGLTRGWLPWRTLGLPPLRDSSGTCLWYERNGTTARVIAAGAPGSGQSRSSLASRPVCGGNDTASNYVDTGDAAVGLTLDTTLMTTRCP